MVQNKEHGPGDYKEQGLRGADWWTHSKVNILHVGRYRRGSVVSATHETRHNLRAAAGRALSDGPCLVVFVLYIYTKELCSG